MTSSRVCVRHVVMGMELRSGNATQFMQEPVVYQLTHDIMPSFLATQFSLRGNRESQSSDRR